jgi:glycosyltransferase involved in cell wall biosynthesis
VHINTHDIEGGAAKIAWRLMLEQVQNGHDARLLVGQKKSKSRRVRKLDPQPDPVLEPFCRDANLQYLHFQGTYGLADHPAVRAADVVHLHNIHFDYFNPVALSALSHAKPVVWTLHDMHALTGFCNHAFDCLGWRTGCRGCDRRIIDRISPNFAGTQRAPLAALGIATAYRIKKMTYDASFLHVVSPSAWLGQKAAQGLFAQTPRQVIPNGVDVRVFSPKDTARARTILGLPQKAFIVGAAAVYGVFDHPLKGGELVREAFCRLRALVPEALFLNIGADGPSRDEHIVNIAFIRDERRMAQAYAAMDCLFYATAAETFCLVAAEALASGRPVTAFDTGPLPEIVRHGIDGLLAPAGDPAALAACAARLAADPESARRMGRSGRDRAVELFDFRRVAASYLELYRQLAAEHAARTRAPRFFDLGKLPLFVQTPAFLAAEAAKSRSAPPPRRGRVRLGESPPFDALALLERFLESAPGEDERLLFAPLVAKEKDYRRVFALRREKRFDEALAILSGLLADWPQEERFLRTLGVTLGLAGRIEDARRHFEACLAATPPIKDIWLTMADMYRLLGDPTRSLAAVEAMEAADPSTRGISFRRGLILEARGDFAGAAAMYRAEYDRHGGEEAREKYRRVTPAGRKRKSAD